MELKVTTKTTHYVDAYDLCRFLTEKMGRKVEFGDSPNDTDYTVDVVAEEPGEYDKEDLDKILEDGYISCDYPGWWLIMNHAALKGWIEPGNYVVRVSW